MTPSTDSHRTSESDRGRGVKTWRGFFGMRHGYAPVRGSMSCRLDCVPCGAELRIISRDENQELGRLVQVMGWPHSPLVTGGTRGLLH